MFFNPLFIQAMNGGDAGLQKPQKIGNSSYLFSDIMKVQIKKGETAEGKGSASIDLSSLKTLQSLTGLTDADMEKLSSMSEDEMMEMISQLLAQFGLGQDIMAQIMPADGTSAQSELESGAETVNLGSDVKAAALKIMDLLKQGENVSLKLTEGTEEFSVKLQSAQGEQVLSKKEFAPVDPKFSMQIEKGEKVDPKFSMQVEKDNKEAIADVVKNSKAEAVSGEAEVDLQVEKQPQVKQVKSQAHETSKNIAQLQKLAAENTPAVEGAEQTGKKGKSKAAKSEVNGISNNSNTEGTKVAVSSKSVSPKESKADYTETPSENKSEAVEGKKAESGEMQSTKVNENKTSFDKELTHQIATTNKELKTEAASTVRTTAASSPIIRTVKVAEVMNEITQIIKGQDKHTVILKIEPENLGKVKIALEMSNSSLDAKIHVESEQVKAIVESNAKQLTQSLTQNGIQLNSLTVSLSTSEQKAGRQPSFTNKKKNSGHAMDMDSEIENAEVKELNKKLGYNTYEYLA